MPGTAGFCKDLRPRTQVLSPPLHLHGGITLAGMPLSQQSIQGDRSLDRLATVVDHLMQLNFFAKRKSCTTPLLMPQQTSAPPACLQKTSLLGNPHWVLEVTESGNCFGGRALSHGGLWLLSTFCALLPFGPTLNSDLVANACIAICQVLGSDLLQGVDCSLAALLLLTCEQQARPDKHLAQGLEQFVDTPQSHGNVKTGL